MIARIWRGAIRAADVMRYAEYMRSTGLSDYRGTAGNRGALLLVARDGHRAEIIALSFWDSFDAIRRFAGDEPSQAVFYPDDEHFLLERELTVRHYEVLDGVDALRSATPEIE